MGRRCEALQQQMMDVQGLLQNLTSLQLNSYVCAHHHRIHQIVVKGENGVWAASEKFPRTMLDLVTLDCESAVGH